MRIFVTGVTGFLGFHIACECLKAGHIVLCLRRETSISFFSQEQEHNIEWVTQGSPLMKETIKAFRPEILIHCAWQGASANARNNEMIQHQNLQLFIDILNLYNYTQIIALGSQEEYGCLNEIIDENVSLNPQSEYAKNKISCCEVLHHFSVMRGYEWQWIRVFNIYGEKQKITWLIPTIITECLNNKEKISVTEGMQQYAYLYCGDFAKAIVSIIGKTGKSGIYNLSSSRPLLLRDLFFKIKKVTKSNSHFDFGAFPYRENQSMLICGNCKRFIDAFGEFEFISIEDGLIKTITDFENESI